MSYTFFYKYRNLITILAILFVSALMHLQIFNRDLIGIHVWRQSQTQLNIQNFYRTDNNILNPRGNIYDGNELKIFRTDFPLMQWTIAQLYYLFGEDIFITRLSMFILGIFSVIGIFLLSQLLFKSFLVGCFTAWAFNFSPVFYYYTMNPLPDNLALCCTIWSIFFFVQYRQQPVGNYVVLSAFFLGIATLVKLPYIITSAIFAVYFIRLLTDKNSASIKKAFTFAFPYLLLIVPAVCWHIWVIPSWGNNMVLKGSFNYNESAARVMEILNYHFNTMFPTLLFNYVSLFISMIGIAAIFLQRLYKKALFWQIGTGGIMVIVYFLFEFFPIDIIHDYYMMPFLPYLFLLTGLGAKFMIDKRRYAKYILLCSIISIPLFTYRTIQDNWTVERSYSNDFLFINQADLKKAVPSSEKCIMLNDASSYVWPYLLDKRGYAFTDNYLPKEWIEDMIRTKNVSYMYSDSRVVDSNTNYQYLFDSLLMQKGTIKVFKLIGKDRLHK